MKTYNKSLDFMTLAMVAGRQGDPVRAAKLFASAIGSPDAVRAVQILEASNKAAYASEQAAITAAKKPVVAAPAPVAKAKAKPAPVAAKVKPAAKPVKAAKEVVAEFDMGDADLDALIGEGDADDTEEFDAEEEFGDDDTEETEVEEVAASEGEEEGDEEEDDADEDEPTFAAVLASMPQIVSRSPKRR